MKKIILTSLAVSALLLAQDTTPRTIKANANLGFITTSGNTETTTYSLDSKVEKTFLEKHAFGLTFDGQYASETDQITDKETTTKNKFLTELTYNYDLNDMFSISYLNGWKRDFFSSYSYQLYTGPGVKYKALKTEIQTLNVDGNILYAKDKLNSNNSTDSYSSLRIKGAYTYKAQDNLTLAQDVTYRSNMEDFDIYFLSSVTSAKYKISDMFNTGASYKIDYASKSPNAESTDRTFSLTLGIDY